MSNLNDFIIHSQYPVEKIVWTAEGVNDNTNPNWHNTDWGGYVFEPISQTLNWQNILIDGAWTYDDWNTSFSFGFNGKPTNSPIDNSITSFWANATAWPKGIDFFGYVLPTDCVVIEGARAESVGRAVKYRVWAYLLESDWVSSTTDKTAQDLAYSLQKGTRLAQLSLISENLLEVPNRATRTLYHNLGFRPFCKMWARSWTDGIAGNWSKVLWSKTIQPSSSSLINNVISINSEKIIITVNDDNDPEYQATQYDFLIRIYNYALPE